MVKKFVVTEFQLFEKKIVSTVKRRGFNGKKKAWFDFKRKMFQRCFNCEKEVCFDGKKNVFQRCYYDGQTRCSNGKEKR